MSNFEKVAELLRGLKPEDLDNKEFNVPNKVKETPVEKTTEKASEVTEVNVTKENYESDTPKRGKYVNDIDLTMANWCR